MAENEKTEHYELPKPNPENNVSDEVIVLQQAFDIIDRLFREFAVALTDKMDGNAELSIADIDGLTEELAKKMADDQKFKLAEMTDVTGIENALDNYIMTKAGAGFVFRSALAVLGAHVHSMADVTGLQNVLNTFLSGASSSTEGELIVFQGTSGKQAKGSGKTIASLSDGGAY